MKIYSTAPMEVLSEEESLDILFEFRDLLEKFPETFFEDENANIEKEDLNNAISSLLHWANQRKSKKGLK